MTAPSLAANFQAGREAFERSDYVAALKEWRPLAEQGDADAQVELGFMYLSGQGVPQDDAEAARWYHLAAEQGNAQAQFLLGIIYGKGEGVTQNYVQAHMWFNLAAAHLPPGEVRDKAAETREILAKFMTPAQVAEAQRLAREWKPK